MTQKERRLRQEKIAKAAERRKKRRKKRILFLVVEIVVLMILLGIGYVITKYEKFQITSFKKDDIQINEGAEQEGYTTVALFGGDSREGKLEAGTHADTIMVVSIDNKTKEIRMVSVYRDTLTEQLSGEIKKANNAYFVGGPKDAINMLNKNFDLDIGDYVTVDFKALADVIDLLGGLEVEIQEEEVSAMNDYIGETASVAGKEANMIQESGLQLLDGTQAVTYARIRKTTGGDYRRTERQRELIQKVFEKVLQTDLKTINDIIDVVFPQVSTSFSLKDLIGLSAGVMKYRLGETSGFPFELTDGTVDGIGSVVMPLGMTENVEELHAFLYPKDEYSASDTVRAISDRIANLTGYTREDYVQPKDVSEKEELNEE